MGLYVTFSVLLICIGSLVETNNLNDHFIDIIKALIIKTNYQLIVKYTLLSLLLGILTFVFRKKVIKSERKFEKKSDTILRVDLIGSIYFTIAIIVGGGILLSFDTVTKKYFLIYIILMLVISLNLYFGSFWRLIIEGNSYKCNLESLKIEHLEWTTMYNSVLIGIIVFTGGITFTNFGSNSSLSYFDGVLVSHVVLGAPVIWLLRPMHITMARIRKNIVELEKY